MLTYICVSTFIQYIAPHIVWLHVSVHYALRMAKVQRLYEHMSM